MAKPVAFWLGAIGLLTNCRHQRILVSRIRLASGVCWGVEAPNADLNDPLHTRSQKHAVRNYAEDLAKINSELQVRTPLPCEARRGAGLSAQHRDAARLPAPWQGPHARNPRHPLAAGRAQRVMPDCLLTAPPRPGLSWPEPGLHSLSFISCLAPPPYAGV